MPLLQWMLLALSLLGAAFAHAEVLVLDTQVKRTLDAEIRYLEDPHHTLTLETLPGTPEAWTRNAETTFNKGYSTSAWWLRLTFTNPTDHPQTRYLEIAYAVIDNLQVYIQRDQAPLERHQLGDKQPYHQRLVDHPMFVVPLEWQPGETLTLTLRVVSTGAIQTPMVLWDKAVFQGHSLTYNTLQGFYFGAMFIIAAYNLLLFFTLGERSYLYYVGFVSCMALFLSALTGQAFRYLWPYMTQWNDQAIIVFLAGTLFFGGLFTKQFLKLREFSRGLNLYCIALAVASALIAAAVEWLTYPQLIRLLVPMASITCISFISIGVYAWWRHQPSAKYYCIAWTLLLTSGVILALSKHDVIPSNLLIDHIVQFSSLLEVLLLSFALAERINIERRLRFEAQHDSLLASKRLNEELEERVRERTRELEKLNERLNELSNTDQLTGLKNRRYLEQALQDAWAHKRAQGGLLSVVLMDIDHF
ncbi:MAG: diguanylate cyclase, partial [Gammaproteobacteria bacterium]|nr:diguanylate cyclase [Gammaproteobacteria bacterium]